MNDTVTESTRKSAPSSARRPLLEVVTRGAPRRRWSEEDRARILAEAMAPGAIASHVARRFGVSTGQFYTWRKAMLLRFAPVGVTPVSPKAEFAEARLAPPPPEPSPPLPPAQTGMMEITLPGGAMIRVDAAVDGAALGRVLAALAGR